MKLCSRLLMVFGQNFCEKRSIWVSEPHFGEFMVDYLFALIELFSLSIWFRSYDAKCVELGYSRRGLHWNFTWTGSFPINHSWEQKTRDTGLPCGEDRISLHPLILTQYLSDGETDGYTVYTAACKASFAAL